MYSHVVKRGASGAFSKRLNFFGFELTCRRIHPSLDALDGSFDKLRASPSEGAKFLLPRIILSSDVSPETDVTGRRADQNAVTALFQCPLVIDG